MTPHRFVLSFVWLVLCLPAAAREPAEFHLRVDGMDRRYHLFVPQGVRKHPPLVIVLHGGRGSGLQIMRYTRERFNRLAERDGFVVAYPDAIDGIWDLGEGKVSDALEMRRDDLKFLARMIERTLAGFGGDSARVYATGISRGGQAAYALACKRPGLIRAIAPVAMPLPDFLADDCAGNTPLPLLLIHGTHDPIVPYGGGPVTIGRQDRGKVLSADQTITRFAARNGCSAVRERQEVGAVDVIRYTACDAPVRLYRVGGGGHTWPSGRSGLLRLVVGPTNSDISAADEIWAFFRQIK